MPIALSIPDGVSHMRGVGFPFQGVIVIDFTMIPPSFEMSTNCDALAARPERAGRDEDRVRKLEAPELDRRGPPW